MMADNDAEFLRDDADRIARDIAWTYEGIYLPPPAPADAPWWRILSSYGWGVVTFSIILITAALLTWLYAVTVP